MERMVNIMENKRKLTNSEAGRLGGIALGKKYKELYQNDYLM